MSSFDGVAEVYEASRHRYPSELRDQLVASGALQAGCAVVDLGAGTGQLSTLVADLAASVVAIDPEPDMVRIGQQVTREHPTITWVRGSDHEVLELVDAPVDLVVIGNAFHHMDQSKLLTDLDALLSDSGNVVICSTSIPVWLQDTTWSSALRGQLSHELGRPIGSGGTPDHDSDMAVLDASPFADIKRWEFSQARQRTADSIVGEVVSSASGAIDDDAAARLGTALEPYLTHGSVTENVTTTALIAARPRT